jgi:hypothetical protein
MLPENNEKHVMYHTKTHSSGAEEWCCPVCGRRFLLSWPPNYSQIILEPGDENVLHTGGKDGMQMAEMDASQAEDFLDQMFPCPDEDLDPLASSSESLRPEDAFRLVRWEELLDEIGFEDWWKAEI